jgi:hypothetical protein
MDTLKLRTKAKLRRGLACEKLKRVEEQRRDAEAVLDADPANASAQVCLNLMPSTLKPYPGP